MWPGQGGNPWPTGTRRKEERSARQAPEAADMDPLHSHKVSHRARSHGSLSREQSEKDRGRSRGSGKEVPRIVSSRVRANETTRAGVEGDSNTEKHESDRP